MSTYKEEAVEKLADLQSLGDGERTRYRDDLLAEVEALEPFFAKHYEEKARSESLGEVREALAKAFGDIEWEDGDGGEFPHGTAEEAIDAALATLSPSEDATEACTVCGGSPCKGSGHAR